MFILFSMTVQASSHVRAPGGAADPVPPTVQVVALDAENGGGFAIVIDGPAEGATGGPAGIIHRTPREIRNARVMQFAAAAVAIPATPDNPNPEQPTPPLRHTTIVLWNELHNLTDAHGRLQPGEDGKLHPYRAIRLGGTARFPDPSGPGVPPGDEEAGDGTWNSGDADSDGVFDAGFVSIGETDYRVMLRYAEFNPVGLTSSGAGVPPASPELEPWRVGEPIIPEGLSARDVPASDVDGDGVVDPTGYAGGGCHLYIVQFWTQALEEYRHGLATCGIARGPDRGAATDGGPVDGPSRPTEGAILQFLPWNGYLVRVPNENALAAIRALPFVRHVAPYHPAYRIDADLMARYFGRDGRPPTGGSGGGMSEPRWHFLQVVERGLQFKELVAANAAEIGADVVELSADGYRMIVNCSPQRLMDISRLDAVQYIDEWQPAGEDMDKVRIDSGAVFLATSPLDFRGQGVRGEVMDGNLNLNHEQFSNGVLLHPDLMLASADKRHGTSTYGIVFGSGAGINGAAATGMLPGAGEATDSEGQGIFATYRRLKDLYPLTGVITRYEHTKQLVNPSDQYRACFQSNSWGTGITQQYNTTSANMDDILFLFDLTVCQSQGNEGCLSQSENCSSACTVATPGSRAEGWCKNNVSVGAVYDRNDSDSANDIWLPPSQTMGTERLWHGGTSHPCDADASYCGFSKGPAADGRVKPDLVFYADQIYTATWVAPDYVDPDEYTCLFSATSAATPAVAGCFGLLFQMWHEQKFTGFGGGVTAFADRPRATTAKAMLINTANQYQLPPSVDITRGVQGWGRPNVQNLYNMRTKIVIDNESTVLLPNSSKTYNVQPATLNGSIKATMTYSDPMGTPGTLFARVNDLDLKVTSPSGVVYWGNHGLANANWSSAGGSADLFDTVENVFIQSAEPGTWKVQVIVKEVNQDGHTETPQLDVDYALVITGVTTGGGLFAPPPPVHDSLRFFRFLDGFFGGEGEDVNRDGVSDEKDVIEYINKWIQK